MKTQRAVHLLISGRVQGVWYRASTRDEAVRLGLTGWVRNLPDGRVEAFAQGPPERVQALIDWCWKGPPMARVDEVTVEERDPEPGLGSFEVRY